MKKIGLMLWNNPVLFAAVVIAVVSVTDLPGPAWLWATIGVGIQVLATRTTDGPVTSAAKDDTIATMATALTASGSIPRPDQIGGVTVDHRPKEQ